MLALVEPTNLFNLTDRPNLGCAMLIGACRQQGIETRLIKAQTRYIRDMFIDDSDELWHLFQDLKADPKDKRLSIFKQYFSAFSLQQFRTLLKTVYQEIFINKSMRTCLDAQKISQFIVLYEIFSKLYIHYILRLKHTNLRIIDRYVQEIVEISPQYVGYSIRGAFSPLSRIIIKRVKEITGAPVIVGGSLTPFINPDELEKVMGEEGFDYLVVGAGEKALPQLLDALENKREPKGIANVFYKSGGRVKGNKLEVVEDLDALHFPDFSQFDLDLYPTPVRMLPLQSARGCYWRKCAFCSHHKIDLNRYKTWRVDRIIEILEYLHSTHGCKNFFLDDESISPTRARHISEALIANGLKIKLEVRGRFDAGFNDSNLLKLMRSAGFASISWGMESGCQRILDRMNKGIRKKNISDILIKAHQNKISNMCFIFCGFPGETKEEWHETIDFLKKHHPYIDGIIEGVFFLNQYAPIGLEPWKWGVTLNEKKEYSTEYGMSIKEINTYYRLYMDRYYAWRSEQTNSHEYIKSGFNGHLNRMMLFYIAGHILPQEKVKQYFLNNDYDNLYPVLLGNISQNSNRTTFQPRNLEKSFFANFMEPAEKKELNPMEKECCRLADGTHSISDIAGSNIMKTNLTRKEWEQNCLCFFKEAFERKNIFFLYPQSK